MSSRFALALSLLASIAAPAAAKELDAETVSRLEGRDVIVQSKQRNDGSTAIRVRALINAPAAKVWGLIEDCNKYTKTMLRTKSAAEISRKGDVHRCRVVIAAPFPLKDLVAISDAKHTVDPGKRYRRKWTLVGGDFLVNEGSWTVTPWKGDPKRSLVVYQNRNRPKVEIPAMIRRAAVKKTLPELFAHLRKQVE